MNRKTLGMLALAGVGAFVASQWQDVVRYVKIRQISVNGDPGLVPAGGRTSYPSDAAHAAAEGKEDFDSASRGGPADS